MRTGPGRLAAVVVLAAFGAGCGIHDSSRPSPEPRVQPSAVPDGPRARDCTTRVDALIDSHTIPRSDRDYAIGMCTDNH